MADTITYKIGEDLYDVPSKDVEAFLKEQPSAIEVQSFVIDKDTFDVPINEVDAFLQEQPTATPLKKKDESVVSAGVQAFSEESKTSSELESPLPLPETPTVEQPKETAKTLGEVALAATGRFNQGLANLIDKVDYVQTLAGDSFNQIVLGKDAMNEIRKMREEGTLVNPNPLSGGAEVRPFRAMADALRWTASGTKELPETTAGAIVGGVAGVLPDIAATFLFPEFKTAQILSKLGIKAVSKFGMVLGAEKMVEGGQTAQTTSEQWTAPMLGAFEGYTTGMLYDGFSLVSGKAGQFVANKLLPKGDVLNKALIGGATSTTTNATIFGGYATGQEKLETGQTSGNTFLTNFGVGLAFGIKDLGRLSFAKAVNTFTGMPTDRTKIISKSEITAEELRDAGINKLQDIEQGKSADPEADLAAANMNLNVASVKAVTDAIKTDTKDFIKTIEDSSLDTKLKEEIIDRVNEVVADSDPKVQQAKQYTDEIKDIDADIDRIKKNKTLSSVEKELQTEVLNTKREELKNKVADIYNIPTEKEPKQEEGKGQTGGDKQSSIIDISEPSLDGAVVYRSAKPEDNITLEISKDVTDKTTLEKIKQFENDANEKLTTKRTEIINDIRVADLKAKKGGVFVDYKGNRYKIIDKGNGEYAVTSITRRTEKGVPSRVTNDALKKQVLDEYYNQSRKLSKIQQELYDTRVDEYKQELKKEIDEKVRQYQIERGEYLPEVAEFEEKETIEPKPSDVQQPVAERKELPSEQTPATKKFIDTWQQFKKELSIEERASKAGARAMKEEIKTRAEKLKVMFDMPKRIKEEVQKDAEERGLEKGTDAYNKFINYESKARDPFNYLPRSVRNAIDKKIIDASISEAKYRQAVQYIDKALTDAEFVKYENDKFDLIEQIEKITSNKKLFEKGVRGGFNPKVKKGLLTKGEQPKYNNNLSIIDALRAINGLVKNSEYVDPLSNKKVDVTTRRLENTEKIAELNNKIELSESDIQEINSLKSENELLEFIDIKDQELYRIKELKDVVDNLIKGQATKAQADRDARHTELTKVRERIISGITGGKEVKYTKRYRPGKRTKRSRFFAVESANFWSLNSLLMGRDVETTGKLPIYDDILNSYAKDKVMPAHDVEAKLRAEFWGGYVNAVRDIFKIPTLGGSGAVERKVMDLERKDRITIDMKGAEGELYSPFEAIQKLFQWRRSAGRKDMERMGFTQDVIDKIDAQLTPQEKELMLWMEDQMLKFSDIYDKAYINENAVSFRVPGDFYWTITRDRTDESHIEEVGQSIFDRGIKHDRTIALTKNKHPLAYGSAMGDLKSFVNEAIEYSAWATPLRELQYVYKDPSLRRLIQYEFGTDVMNALDLELKTFAGNNVGEGIKWLDYASSGTAGAILGMKFMPVLNQMASNIYYLADMSPKEYGAGLYKTFATIYSPREQALTKLLYNSVFVKERQATAATSLGLDINILSGQLREQGINVPLKRLRTYIPSRTMQEVAATPLRLGDLFPVIFGGKAYVETKYQKYAGKKLTTDVINNYANGNKDVNLEKAINDWEFFSMITQQSLRKSNKSIATLRGSIGRTVGLFTSGPLSAHRLTVEGARTFYKGYKSNNTNQMLKGLQRMVVGHVISGLMFGMLDNKFRFKDKEDWRHLGVAALLGNLEGLAYIGRLVSTIKSQWMDSPWANDYRLQITPVIRNIENAWKSMDLLSKEVVAKEPDANKIKEYSAKLATATSMLYGLPVDGTLKFMKGIQGVARGTNDILSWETFGIYDDENAEWIPEGDVPIGTFKNIAEAEERTDYYIGWTADNKLKMASPEEFMSLAEQIAGSGFDVAMVFNNVFRKELRNRFRYIYGKYGDVNTPEDIEKLLVRLRKEKIDVPKEDMDKLKEMYKYMQDFNVSDEIKEGMKAAKKFAKKASKLEKQPIMNK